MKLLVLMVTAAAIGTDFWMVQGSRLSLEAAAINCVAIVLLTLGALWRNDEAESSEADYCRMTAFVRRAYRIPAAMA